jgi:prepilin-type N-terminal cleavage/methylation domain-containing protein
MNTRKSRGPRRRSRAGFTLAELMIVATLMGIIGALLTALLVRQQRFHRAVAALADSRARMRDIETILPTDLRGISTVGGDLYEISDTSIQFRAFTGASVLCAMPSTTLIEVPPKVMAIPTGATNQVGTVLTAWINAPLANDQVFIYNDSSSQGNADDSWQRLTVSTVDSSTDFSPNACLSTNAFPVITAADNASRRYRFTLGSTLSPWIRVGSPIRFAREVRYSGYVGADNQWYVGYQTCTPTATGTTAGTCGTREVLAGPIKPLTADTLTSGLFFVFYDQYGIRKTAISASDTLARISVGIRTTSESLRRASGSSATITGGDSLRFTVGIRNRI